MKMIFDDLMYWSSVAGSMAGFAMFLLLFPEDQGWIFAGMMVFCVVIVALELWAGRRRRRNLVRAAMRARRANI